MAGTSTHDYSLWQSLDTELVSLLDHFGNLIRAAHIPDEDIEAATSTGRDRQAPGDLLEIWAEKLSYTGLAALHITSQLKKGALLSDFSVLMANVRSVRGAFEKQESSVNAKLPVIRSEVQRLLADLETSYYSSKHRGTLVSSATSEELGQLSQLAMEFGERRHA